MTTRIAPSLLSADFAHIADEVKEVESIGADLLHLDLMDGRFVPNLTFGPILVATLADHTEVPLDAHLMVVDPDPYIEPLARAGVARIAVHVESCIHLHRTLGAIRALGVEPGVAINPATSVSAIEQALCWVDFVLVMSVNPGFGGQAFIPETVDKIRRLSELAGKDRDLDITVDGGVGVNNAQALVAAGATSLVAGSAVLGQANRRQALEAIRLEAQKGELQ